MTRDLIFLVPLSFYFLLYGLGGGSLASWDEAIYASVASHVFHSGDWLRLSLNSRAWLDHPPLAVWITAGFYHLFGQNEFSARLFSALCGTGVVVMTYLLGTRLLSRWAGFMGALVLLSSSHFLRFARFGMLDAPLTFLLTLALYFFWLGQNRNRYLVFSGIAAGLAILTKGSAAFLIFIISWAYMAWGRRGDLLSRSSYWVGVMLAVVIALPWSLWGLYLHHAQASSATAGFAIQWPEVFGMSAPFYLRVLVNKYHPWILIGILSAPYFLFRAIKDREEEVVFLSVWMIAVFGALSFLHDKQGGSLMILYPALSLSVGWLLSRFIPERKAWAVRLLFAAVLLLHIPYSNIFDHDYSRPVKELAPAIREALPVGEKLGLYRYHESAAVSFYALRDSYDLEDPAAAAQAAREKGFCLLVEAPQFRGLGGEAFLARHELRVKGVAGSLMLLVKKS